MGGKRCRDVWHSAILGFLFFVMRGQCDYIVNGKLTSGNTIGDTTYQHILLEEATHSRAPRPGVPWVWPGGGESQRLVSQTAGRGCYDLRRTSERIDSRFIRRVLRTRNRSECEQECDREPLCKGFNYRYEMQQEISAGGGGGVVHGSVPGRFKTQGFNQYRDNCQLSYQDGSSDFDFHKDLDFDFYEKEYDSRNCHPRRASASRVRYRVVSTKPYLDRDPGDFWNNNQGGHGNNYGGYGNNYGGNGNNYGGNGNNDGGQYGGNYGGGREEYNWDIISLRGVTGTRSTNAVGKLMIASTAATSFVHAS
ncbi:hypothetical protein GWK47_035419 [Chionoecetes opilio]|uniref:Apple domain-containing protein n=1 Tax=Chionoecetes opilio TaxID=41210 RepID=A0A8J4YI60_CHIOP|nr:hypothetical protein GWK47_035419 [Chionoecetes opilio]